MLTYNTALGYNALKGSTNPAANTGVFNTAIGAYALLENINGSGNSSFGTSSLHDNTSGENNVATGYGTAYRNTTGSRNTAIGTFSLLTNSSGNENVAVGFEALRFALSNNNTAIGNRALVSNVSGLGNTAVGSNALNSNTTGNYNTSIGAEATVSASGFSNATAIGANALVGASNSLVLGSIIGINGASANVNVGIGTTVPVTRLQIANGMDATLGATSGFLVLGQTTSTSIVIDDNEIMSRNNGGISTLYLQADGGGVRIGGNIPTTHQLEVATNDAFKTGSANWIIPSDTRLKKDIKPFTDGLDLVRKINPIWFRYNGMNGITDTARFAGIIAQEIQKIAPYMINTIKSATRDGESYLSYDANAMTYILINAVKEQQALIETLQHENAALQNKYNASISDMEQKLLQMEAMINKLAANREM